MLQIIPTVWFWSYSLTMCIGNPSWGLPVKKRWQVNASHWCPQLSLDMSRRGQSLCGANGLNPLTPHPASFNGTDANVRKVDQLTEPDLRLVKRLSQGQPVDESVHPLGLARQALGRRKMKVSGLGEFMALFLVWTGFSRPFIGWLATGVWQADTHAWESISKKPLHPILSWARVQ